MPEIKEGSCMNNKALRAGRRVPTTHTWFLQTGNMRNFIMKNWNRQGIRIDECREYSVSDIFCCGYALYFWQGIQLRYPEYCREQRSVLEKALQASEQAKHRVANEKKKQNEKKCKAENHHKYIMGGIIVKYLPDCCLYNEGELNRILPVDLQTKEC